MSKGWKFKLHYLQAGGLSGPRELSSGIRQKNEVNSETSLSNEIWKVTKFLNEFKKHFHPVHNEFLIANTAPIVIRSSIFYRETMKKKGQPQHSMMMYKELLKEQEDKKSANVAKGGKGGVAPKKGEYIGMFICRLGHLGFI